MPALWDQDTTFELHRRFSYINFKISIKKIDFQDHLATVHGREDPQKNICDICGKGFFYAQKLKGQRLTHGEARPFPCRLEGCNLANKSSGKRKKPEVIKLWLVWTYSAAIERKGGSDLNN